MKKPGNFCFFHFGIQVPYCEKVSEVKPYCHKNLKYVLVFEPGDGQSWKKLEEDVNKDLKK